MNTTRDCLHVSELPGRLNSGVTPEDFVMTDNTTFTERTLDVAETVADHLESLNIACAVIGGTALSVHGYTRATEDFDLGIILVDASQVFPDLNDEFSDRFSVDYTLAGPGDPLGGAMTVEGVDFAPIEIINLLNIQSAAGRNSPASDAIANAQSGLIEGSKLRVVTLPYLVVLKLHAGGLQDLGDVVQLLEYNPDADLREVQQLCEQYGVESKLERVLDDLDR